MGAQLWEVIGGAEKGGVIVRTAVEVGSPQLPDRLSTGALVRQRALEGLRLHYERVTGSGPNFGWVTISLPNGKELLARTDKLPPSVSRHSTSNAQDGYPKAKPKAGPKEQLLAKAKAPFPKLSAPFPPVMGGAMLPVHGGKGRGRGMLPHPGGVSGQGTALAKGGELMWQRGGFPGAGNPKAGGMIANAVRCQGCGMNITGDYTFVEEAPYHYKCFCCVECQQQIEGSFFKIEDKYVCEACIMKELPVCARCNKPIPGEVMAAEGSTYHLNCFVCEMCNVRLTGEFFPDRGKNLCEKCMLKQLPKCAKCRQPIDGEVITAETKTFHVQCFTCFHCGDQITGLFSRHNNQFACELCHGEVIYPRCAWCQEPIRGEIMAAEGKQYHQECFVCDGCHRPVTDKYMWHDRNLLCEPCYADTLPKCAWCSQPIMGNFTTAKNKTYHTDCFTCNSCGNPITSQYYQLKDHLLCQRCHHGKAPRCVACKGAVHGDYLVASGAPYHTSCFKCGSCKQPIDGRYLLMKGPSFLCEICRSSSLLGNDKRQLATRNTSDASDQWASTRLPRLQRELRDLQRCPPSERKRRLRGLQLELHPDKQPPERRPSAGRLFHLVQEEWEATLAEEKGQRASRGKRVFDGREDWQHARQAWYAGA